jgi:hypothetical protein
VGEYTLTDGKYCQKVTLWAFGRDPRLSNIKWTEFGKSVSYLLASRRNIRHWMGSSRRLINGLVRFGARAENPRVGGSIPLLATIKKNEPDAQGPIKRDLLAEISFH